VCIWEIGLDAIKGSLTAAAAISVVAAGKTFANTFADALNAPAAEYLPPLDPDGLFLFETVLHASDTFLFSIFFICLSGFT
jgi:hypothetical protein